MCPAKENGAADQVFNLSEALERVGGDKELLKEIAEIFKEDYPHQLKQIRDGIAGGDAHLVERASHSVKGSAGNFGAQRVYDAAYRLEVIGKEGKMEEAEGAFEDLERELNVLEEALKTLYFSLQKEAPGR